MPVASENRNKPSSEMDVAPGGRGCRVPGRAGVGGSSVLPPAGQLEAAGFLEQAYLPGGLGLLPADAHVYPGWAGGTWMLVLEPGSQELGQLSLDSHQDSGLQTEMEC